MNDLVEFVTNLVASGRVETAAAAITVGGKLELQAAASGEVDLPADPSCWLFDLASLTKPVVATAALVLVRDGELDLAEPIGSLLPELAGPVAARPLAALLAHRAGLAAWTPLAERGWDLDQMLAAVGPAGLADAPRPTYSDLGYLALGRALERRSGSSLAKLITERVALPLGAEGLGPSPGPQSAVVPCHLDRSREAELAAAQGLSIASIAAPPRGWAQDGNARAIGKVCGHAGLFGRVDDVLAFAEEWRRPTRLLTPGLVAHAVSTPSRGRFLLGWWRRRVRGAAGRALSPRSFGHVGFVGGSVWIDPELELVAVLLAHRSSTTVDLTPARQQFHRLAAGVAGAPLPRPPAPDPRTPSFRASR